jgi:guanine deaminase
MNRWMQIAHSEATKGMLANDGGPFGAVVVKSEKIIATAHNEVLKTNDPTAHAEITAIRRASEVLGSFELSGCDLYTTCYPCPMCLGAIYWARISNVYYGATKDDAQKGGFDDKNFYEMIGSQNSSLNMKQIDHKENAQLFDEWLKKADKKMY